MAKSSLMAKHLAIPKLIANKSVRRIALENALICLFRQNPRNLGWNRVVFSYMARAKAWQKRTPGLGLSPPAGSGFGGAPKKVPPANTASIAWTRL
jgi:hypothetical protein